MKWLNFVSIKAAIVCLVVGNVYSASSIGFEELDFEHTTRSQRKKIFNDAKKHAEESDCLDAKRCLAQAYAVGFGTAKNPVLAFSLMSEVADANEGLLSAWAKYMVGKMNADGFGTDVNGPRAVSLLEEVANVHEKFLAARAKLALAILYDQGKVVEPNGQKALGLYDEVAQAKFNPTCITAMYHMAMIYHHGANNVVIDIEKALFFYDCAASCGHPAARQDLNYLMMMVLSSSNESFDVTN